MASSFTTVNGIKILTPTPTGEGGKALNENFTALAIRTARISHVQSQASDKWTITHQEDRRPQVVTADSNGDQIFGDVSWKNGVVIIRFTRPVSGTADLF